MHYDNWFQRASDGRHPWPWQVTLGNQAQLTDLLIRIPTGLGKTLGVLAAWGFNRVERGDAAWPRRLVWCLPMRTLVEQTAIEAELFVQRAGLSEQVGVHKLLGGSEETAWFDDPDRLAILVGTQDMLLSRALNRGYAMGRAAWPRAFGLINSDVLWVMDEVQLMGVGLSTATQIQSFWHRRQNSEATLPIPRATWWMSATLQQNWLQATDDLNFQPARRVPLVSVAAEQRTGASWESRKPLGLHPLDPEQWGEFVLRRHLEHEVTSDTGRQTLVIVNTVKSAVQLFENIRKLLQKSNDMPEIKLLHSRFRPHERQDWGEFLQRSALTAETNRILIATQVVEAGVDISSSCLVTELAPWTSLVQRFGRAARYGGVAEVVVLDSQASDDKKAAPYTMAELKSARRAIEIMLERSWDASIRSLELFEESLRVDSPALLAELYPYQPLHVLLSHEFEELFDTTPDLTGADLDVGRFIREGDERDLQVFWREWDKSPSEETVARAAELCPVPIGDARAWIKKIASQPGVAFAWDYLDGRWATARPESLRPGLVLVVNSRAGGYDPAVGFTGQPLKKGQVGLDISQQIPLAEDTAVDSRIADQADSSDALSQQDYWKTILTHSREAQAVANRLTSSLNLPERLRRVIDLSLRLHDWGKAHPAFANGTYRVKPERTDLAKAPNGAWRAKSSLYSTPTHGNRRGFRHELASCLAILELLRQSYPHHAAIDSSEYAWLRQTEGSGAAEGDPLLCPLADELFELTRQEFDLLLFLVAAHHGKVRLSMQSSPKDQDFPAEQRQWCGSGMPIRGIRHNDELLPTRLPTRDGVAVELPALVLRLDISAIGLSPRYGRSWTERMLELIHSYGPFTLGYLEAIVRSADIQASRLTTPDPELAGLCLEIGTDDAPPSQVIEVDGEDDGLVEAGPEESLAEEEVDA